MSDIFYIGYLLNCLETLKIPDTEEEFITSMKKRDINITPGYYKPKDCHLKKSEENKVLDALVDFTMEKDIPLNNLKDVLAAMCDFKTYLYNEMTKV